MTMRRPYPFTYPYDMSNVSYPQYYCYVPDAQQYNRKRQRRQAAAVVVESLWNNNSNNSDTAASNMGRKSTAQPRPVLNVPPRGIGPIQDPNENDVLCGRGGRINSHAGNVQFRDIINSKKKEYLAPTTKKLEKAHIAAAIVNDIRSMNPPGRFLKEDRGTGLWFDIGDAKAIKKTGQALREDAPEIRPELGEDSSGDEKRAASPKRSPTRTTSSPKNSPPRQQHAQAHHAPHDAQVWPQGNAQLTHHDYQAQMAMPPPFVPPQNPAMNYSMQQQQQQQQAFETRNIPIQPPPRQNLYAFPTQLYSGARSVTSRVASASKHAMEALSQAGPAGRAQNANQRPPDDIAFGRHFQPLESQSAMSSDNTISTISGISDTLSSGLLGSGTGDLRASTLMNMSLKSSTGPSRRDPSLRMSGLTISGNRPSLGMSGLSRSATGSLSRSLSFPDMSSIVEGENWRAIMEADDELVDETAANTILSGVSAGGRHSLSSGRSAQRNSSAMSIGGLSMDLASNASSTQWLAAAGLTSPPMADDATYMSGASRMSAELDALDLASFRM